MDNFFVVSLPRIQRNSAEHLNKLEKFCSRLLNLFLRYSQRFFDKFTYRITFDPKKTQVDVART